MSFSLLMTFVISAVTFLEYWKRKTASLAHHWDCLDFEEEEVSDFKFIYLHVPSKLQFEILPKVQLSGIPFPILKVLLMLEKYIQLYLKRYDHFLLMKT